MNRPNRTLFAIMVTLACVCSPPRVMGATEPAVAPVATQTTAQFGGQCAEGLASGRHVMTNCSIQWTDRDGKRYCFSNDAARKSFLENPVDHLHRARDFIAASSVESTEKAMQYFEGGDAETLVQSSINDKITGNGGVFALQDPLNGELLQLAFDGVDFTRTIDGYGFFPDVKFHDAKNTDKKYLIDFWVAPEQGQLQIQETRIYEAPVLVDGKYVTMARQPVPWWWIPASEHPGHLATKRSWEVMSAVESGALNQSARDGGIFTLKDDKTGQPLRLQFIDTHQPVRQLDDNGHYFACTDFRAVGTPDQIYDIDFWVTDKDGKMTVDQARVHKVPEKRGDRWIQVPRYDWKEFGNSHVVP